MPSGNRRLPRTVRNGMAPSIAAFASDCLGSNRYAPLGAAVPTLPALEQPLPPKHFPFPNTPIDDDVFFELLMCFFSVICGGLQYLHLYRTVWWLPHSYTSQALNFYLIDLYLVVFIAVILSRRLIYLLGCHLLEKFVDEEVLQNEVRFYYRTVLFGVICLLLTICAYYVMQNHPIVNMLYLCYPIMIYLILFGLNVQPFFDLINWNADTLPALHACSSNAVDIRKEVENLRMNFNNRMKQILFSAILNAYYAGFIPCCFAQTVLHYDVYWATQHVMFIFLSCFIALTVHILSLRYCDILHRSALHLGDWDKLETRNLLLVNNNWKEDTLWPCGVLVRHGRDIYRAQGECNASEPGNSGLSRFYSIFKNPSFPLSVLFLVHILMIVFQLILLVRSTFWYNIVSITFLLFFNYYVLYKLCRDYLVSYKIYKEEKQMHTKINIR